MTMEQPEVPALEHTELQPGEGSSTVIPRWSIPNMWGGPRLTWRGHAIPEEEPVFTLDDREEMELWQDFQGIGLAVEKSLKAATNALTQDMASVAKVRAFGLCPELTSDRDVLVTFVSLFRSS